MDFDFVVASLTSLSEVQLGALNRMVVAEMRAKHAESARRALANLARFDRVRIVDPRRGKWHNRTGTIERFGRTTCTVALDPLDARSAPETLRVEPSLLKKVIA